MKKILVEFIFASSWAVSHARSMEKQTKKKNEINVPEYVSNNLVQTSKFLVAEPHTDIGKKRKPMS